MKNTCPTKPQGQPRTAGLLTTLRLRFGRRLLFGLVGGAACLTPAAHAQQASELSAASTLPLAVSVTTSSLLLSGVTTLSIVSIEAVAQGSVWVLERASDGARFTLRLSSQAAGALSVVSGQSVQASAVGAGWLLHHGGKLLAFVPNELGRALLHQERITP